MAVTQPQNPFESRPRLLSLLGAKSPGHVLVFSSLPLTAGFLALGWGQVSASKVWALIFLGVGYWTFFEYAMHRYFYHWVPRRLGVRKLVEAFHVYHHRNPADRRVWNAGPLISFPLSFALFAVLSVLLWSVQLAALAMVGSVAAHTVYEWVHRQCHVRNHRGGVLGFLQRFHLHHHRRNARACFGVTNPFWDLAFGTADWRSMMREP